MLFELSCGWTLIIQKHLQLLCFCQQSLIFFINLLQTFWLSFHSKFKVKDECLNPSCLLECTSALTIEADHFSTKKISITFHLSSTTQSHKMIQNSSQSSDSLKVQVQNKLQLGFSNHLLPFICATNFRLFIATPTPLQTTNHSTSRRHS